MRRLLCAVMSALLMLCIAAPAIAQVEGGMYYDLFLLNYEENISFINNNTGRHMLPMLMSKSRNDDGSTRFEIIGDTLSVAGDTDLTGQLIATIRIVLTLPQPDLKPGTLMYGDFQTSGYHSYALLMAMDASPTAQERYALVTRVEGALKQALDGGSRGFVIQVGSYELTAERGADSMTLSFVNSALIQSPAPQGGEDITDEPIYTDEPAIIDNDEDTGGQG